PGRYDEPLALPRPVLIAVAALLLLAVTAGSFWAYQRSTKGTVAYQLLSYRIISDTSVTVTFEVRKPGGSGAVCRVEALGNDGGPVGGQDVQLAPGSDARVTTTLTTTARAYSGVVQGCREQRP
ncbi:MAG: secretion protein HlyD family protein, partial [Frankiales bacterium]|nr:secretion protein HlyD family protein [Frankiales bacterium]